MAVEYCNVNLMMDGNYFDITHSFKIDSSTYHVLGLRQDRPTYGNTYYIFNCINEQHQSPIHSSRTLPSIHQSRISEHGSFMTAHARSRVRTASPKKATSNITAIKQTLIDVLKTEHQSLVVSLRKEISVEKNILCRSIEKKTETFTKAASNEKQEILLLLEEKLSTLKRTYESHASSTISSIELLKSTITETLNAQHEQLQSLDQLQITLSKMIEREVEKIMVKHLETYRSTFVDITTVKQLQDTLVETFEKRSTTITYDNDNNNDSLKYLLAEQTQYLTDLITKQHQTHSLDSRTVKQLQSTVVETLEKFSITKKDNNDNNDTNALNRLFTEQRQYLTELITKQQQAFSLDFKQTVVSALKEQMAKSFTTITSIDVAHNRRHPFKISIKTAEFAHVYAELFVAGNECLGCTLCQRDPSQADVVNCFVAPPMGNEPFKLTIYAKTNSDTQYRAALCIQMPFPNGVQPITFPHLYQPFKDHQCILIEPLQRILKQNEQVLIHMVIPDVRGVKIRNGDDYIVLNRDEFRNGIVKKKIQVRGDLVVCGQWNGKNDLDICAFEMDANYIS